MATATIKGFIHKSINSEDFALFGCDMTKYGYVLVCPYEFAFEIPATFNPIAAQVSALEKQRDKVRSEFNMRIAQINDEISKLQCLEFSPREVEA